LFRHRPTGSCWSRPVRRGCRHDGPVCFRRCRAFRTGERRCRPPPAARPPSDPARPPPMMWTPPFICFCKCLT
jgi:hypothetical protein